MRSSASDSDNAPTTIDPPQPDLYGGAFAHPPLSRFALVKLMDDLRDDDPLHRLEELWRINDQAMPIIRSSEGVAEDMERHCAFVRSAVSSAAPSQQSLARAAAVLLKLGESAEVCKRHMERLVFKGTVFRVTISSEYAIRSAALFLSARQEGMDVSQSDMTVSFAISSLQDAAQAAARACDAHLLFAENALDVDVLRAWIGVLFDESELETRLWAAVAKYREAQSRLQQASPRMELDLKVVKLQEPQALFEAREPLQRELAEAAQAVREARAALAEALRTNDDLFYAYVLPFLPAPLAAQLEAEGVPSHEIAPYMPPAARAILGHITNDFSVCDVEAVEGVANRSAPAPADAPQEPPLTDAPEQVESEALCVKITSDETGESSEFTMTMSSEELLTIRRMLESGMAVGAVAEIVANVFTKAFAAQEKAAGVNPRGKSTTDAAAMARLLGDFPAARQLGKATALTIDRIVNARRGLSGDLSMLHGREYLDAAALLVGVGIAEQTRFAVPGFWGALTASDKMADNAVAWVKASKVNVALLPRIFLYALEWVHHCRVIAILLASSTQPDDRKLLNNLLSAEGNATGGATKSARKKPGKSGQKGKSRAATPPPPAERLMHRIGKVEVKLSMAFTRAGSLVDRKMIAEYARVWTVFRRVLWRVWELREIVLAAFKRGDKRALELRRLRAAERGEADEASDDDDEDDDDNDDECLQARQAAFDECAAEFHQLLALRASMVELRRARDCAFIIRLLHAHDRLWYAYAPGDDGIALLSDLDVHIDHTSRAVSRSYFFDCGRKPMWRADEDIIPGAQPKTWAVPAPSDIGATVSSVMPVGNPEYLEAFGSYHVKNVAQFHELFMTLPHLEQPERIRQLVDFAIYARVVLTLDWTPEAGWRAHAQLDLQQYVKSCQLARREGVDAAEEHARLTAEWARRPFWWQEGGGQDMFLSLFPRDAPLPKKAKAAPKKAAQPPAPKQKRAAAAAPDAVGSHEAEPLASDSGSDADEAASGTDVDAGDTTDAAAPAAIEPQDAAAPAATADAAAQAVEAAPAGAPMSMLELTLLSLWANPVGLAATAEAAAAPVEATPVQPDREATRGRDDAPAAPADTAESGRQESPTASTAGRGSNGAAGGVGATVVGGNGRDGVGAQRTSPPRQPLAGKGRDATPAGAAAANIRQRAPRDAATTVAAGGGEADGQRRSIRLSASTLGRGKRSGGDAAAGGARGGKPRRSAGKKPSLADQLKDLESKRYDSAAGELRKLLEEAVGMAARGGGVPDRGPMGSRIEALCERGYLSPADKKLWCLVWDHTSEALHWNPRATWEEGSAHDWQKLRNAKKLILETCTWHKLEDRTTW